MITGTGNAGNGAECIEVYCWGDDWVDDSGYGALGVKESVRVGMG